eukprot:1988866-Rhodomonas_salina.1
MCYAVSGTDVAYAAMRYAVSGTDLAYDAARPLPNDTGTSRSVPISLRAVRSVTNAVCGTELGASFVPGAGRRSEGEMRCWGVVAGQPPATLLPKCYAMSGSDIAYDAVVLRACYALAGTDLEYHSIT